jgi:ABC-type Fe3+ transport system substrate-binding protein
MIDALCFRSAMIQSKSSCMNRMKGAGMKELNEEMTVRQILQAHPGLIDVFARYGLGKFQDPEMLDRLGGILRLKTAMKVAGIHPESFVNMLNSALRAERESPDIQPLYPEMQGELSLLALLPCGMKMPFGRAFDDFMSSLDGGQWNFRHHIEGNVNHEMSYYPYIDSVENIEELPDVIVSSDINSFYHREFSDKFLDTGGFVSLNGPVNETFSEAGFIDPHGRFTMLSANLLVIVAVRDAMAGLPLPESWGDLMAPELENRLALRGDGRFFCGAVLLPYYKMFGIDGILKLARSTVAGMHPSEMVDIINRRKAGGPALFVMPYFFACKIKDRGMIDIIVPREGAIISPVQMLVKKSKLDHVRDITDFLCGSELGQVCADAFFPSTNREVRNHIEDIPRMYWLGWDFIDSNDMGALKAMTGDAFMREFISTGGKP